MSADATAEASPLPEEATEAPLRPAERLHRDLMFLAGELLHRGAQTHFERRAAEFIRDRFRARTRDVEVDDFHAIENPLYLFGSYFGEFLAVGVLAFAWPAFALAYGLGLLIAFLAEFHGVRLFERLLPEFETQNVIARIRARQPRRVIVVTAHYDSGGASPVSLPGVIPWLRPGLIVCLSCMVLVLATCGVEAWADMRGQSLDWLLYPRWMAISVLVAVAGILFYASRSVEDIRGANGNASGVAALLQLADRLGPDGIEGTEIWLAATGSHEAWMAGTRRLLRQLRSDPREVHLLNLESVGAGTLHYTVAEGMLGSSRSGAALVAAAERVAQAHGATPAALRKVPSGAHPAFAAGASVMSIMGLDESGVPVAWNQIDDRVTGLDEATVLRAVDFAEALLRDLAARPSR